MRNSFVIIAAIFLFLSNGCEQKNPDPGYTLVPDVHIDRQINMNEPEYNDLNHPGGYVYLNEGYRGVIVIQTNDHNYKALERACPSNPDKPCAVATVDSSGLYIGCGQYADSQWKACNSSKFNLDGSVMSGPADQPLRSYRIRRDGNYLIIKNSGS